MADGHKPKLVVQTRSPDVVRDCEMFSRIESNGGMVQVNMTVTTDDEDVRRTFEPFCPSNPVRLRAIREVHEAGVDACITMTPLLLVSNPYAFADSLIETGVPKFIAQPFHFQRGKFLAGTRDKAFDLMAEKLGCDRASFRTEYMEHYRKVFEVLRARLPELGEGKDGFKPPFQQSGDLEFDGPGRGFSLMCAFPTSIASDGRGEFSTLTPYPRLFISALNARLIGQPVSPASSWRAASISSNTSGSSS